MKVTTEQTERFLKVTAQMNKLSSFLYVLKDHFTDTERAKLNTIAKRETTPYKATEKLLNKLNGVNLLTWTYNRFEKSLKDLERVNDIFLNRIELFNKQHKNSTTK